MVYVPPISAARGLAEQEGTLEMASLVLSDLAGSWLNARVGRFEPAYVPFSVKRQLSVAPYEVYDLAFPGGPALSEVQSGIELSGYGPQRFQYAAGWVDGSATNAPDDTPADFYGRAAYVINPGEGQTVGQRLGVIGYLGSARPMSGTDTREVLPVSAWTPASTSRWPTWRCSICGRQTTRCFGAPTRTSITRADSPS